MIKERLNKIRSLMKHHNIDLYLIPTSDFHQSEYVGDYFKVREYMSGFSGSAGTLIITLHHAYLWSDGRYFLQASQQLKDTTIQLMKIGVDGFPTILEFLEERKEQTLAFDGRIVSASDAKKYPNTKIIYEQDLVNNIWNNRPPLSCNQVKDYPVLYCGESRTSKIKAIGNQLDQADYHIISTLDDIAWIFNLRGSDVSCNPVFLSHAIISKKCAILYIQKNALDDETKKQLNNDQVIIKDYFSFYDDLKDLKGTILLDETAISFQAYLALKNNPIINRINPSQQLKAIKNEIEIKNSNQAHIKDGIAMCKFMYWLKHNQKVLDEIEISDQLFAFRNQQEDFVGLSFDTICGFNENGAIIHYKATPNTTIKVSTDGLLLIDSGGQYLDGTTDITRTFVIHKATLEQKQDYTTVLKANLHLQHAVFTKDTRGSALDHFARDVIKDYGLDYRHGTGHGVGHYLCVHEGPQMIRPASIDLNDPIMEAGMITSNEPGIYKEGKHGVRIENEILCVETDDDMLSFKVITYCPYDIDAIDASMLDETEKQWINEYHSLVYQTIVPYLNSEEANWLKEITRTI